MLTVNTIPLVEESSNKFIFIDSFETWGTNYGRGRWTTAGYTTTEKARTGSRSMRLSGIQSAIHEVNPFELDTDYSIGVATYPVDRGAYHHSALIDMVSDFWRTGNGIPLTIRTWVTTTASGTFALNFTTSTSIFGANHYLVPGTKNIHFEIWNHIGLKTHYSLDGSDLIFNITLYFNEDPIIEVVDLTIATNPSPLDRFIPCYNSVKLQGSGTAAGISYFDDFYIKKGEFPGDLNIGVIRPDGDTDDTGFTPDTGSEGYSRVNDTLIDGDTSYIQGTTPGIKSVFTMQDIDPGIERIYAIQGSIYAEKTAGGGSQLKPIFGQEGSTDGYQSNLSLYPVSGDVRHLYYCMDKNPATGQEYTPAEVNNILYGVIKVS